MKKPLTPDKLRSMTETGKNYQRKKEAEEKKQAKDKQYHADLKEAEDRINESEAKMSKAARDGKNETSVCVLRGGIHFESDFRTKQNPKFLGTIGRVVYDHFVKRKFKVIFRSWDDPMRMNGNENDSGYQIIVSW